MFLLFALISILCGSVKWAVGFIILFLIFET